MGHYRLYFHNHDGHFQRAEDIDAATDEAAMERAREIDHAHCIEIWQGARLVGLVEPGEERK